ncbi:MAG: hypothetical protein WEC80_01260 [Patescibacteria group bacterium]
MKELEVLIGTKEYGVGMISYPDAIIYAGQSARRKSFLTDIFPNIPTYTFSVDPEPQTPDMSVILEDKLIKGVNYLASLNGQIETNRIAIVAADTRTIVPQLKNEVEPQSLGKPNEEAEVIEVFRDLSRVADYTMEDPTYEVVSVSGAVSPESQSILTSGDRTQITLWPEAAKYLTTSEGFQKYVEFFHAFYNSGAYKKVGMPAQSLTDLSGGLSLPVLLKLGAVKLVDGGDPKNRVNLKKSFFTVAVGIQLDIIEPFNPEAANMIGQWEWLNDVVEGLVDE